MEEQNQQQPQQQPEKPKKKFYKKWWFWFGMIFLAILLFIIGYFTYLFVGTRVPCGYLMGWENTPCTGINEIKDISANLDYEEWEQEYKDGYVWSLTAYSSEEGTIYMSYICPSGNKDIGISFDIAGARKFYNARGELIKRCAGNSNLSYYWGLTDKDICEVMYDIIALEYSTAVSVVECNNN